MTSHRPAHINGVFCAANFNCTRAEGALTANFTVLQDVDVAFVAEPGNFPRYPSRVRELSLAAFHCQYGPRTRPSPLPDQEHRGGALLLVRRSTYDFTAAPLLLPDGTDVQFAAGFIHRRDHSHPFAACVAVYATNIIDTTAHIDQLRAAFSAVRAQLLSLHDVPQFWGGDFNARHPAFGDASLEASARGRMLHHWCVENRLQAVGAPTLGDSALDLLLCPHDVYVSEPSTRSLASSDHKALTADVDLDPSSTAWHFDNHLVFETSIDEALIARTLDATLLGRGGTLHARDGRLLQALNDAIYAAGGRWRRRRVHERRAAPTLEQIIHAANHSPWRAVGMVRRPSLRHAPHVSPRACLEAFGPAGMQPDHDDEPLRRAPPAVRGPPVSDEEVRHALCSHNPSACADQDGITPTILRAASRSPQFVRRFAELIDACLASGAVPGRWLSSTVSPIPKPGKPHDDVTCMRPIYLLGMIAKTADRVVDTRVKQHFRPHHLQLGFRKGVPIDIVPLALAEVCVEAQQRVDGGSRTYTLAIFVDIKCAFPNTPSRSIIEGYASAGVPEDLVKFKIATLTGRRMRVKVRGEHSAWADIRDGTNQGSVSGPTDFSAATTDLLTRLDAWRRGAVSAKRLCGMVADDLMVVVAGARDDIRYAAQAALDIVHTWAVSRQMTISPKTSALFVVPVQSTITAWSGQPLRCGSLRIEPTTGTSKYLGLLLDNRMLFGDAVRHAVAQHDRALHCLMPFLATLRINDRRAVYESVALSHVRRLAPFLHAVYDTSAWVWDFLDKHIASGARCITHASATANTYSVIMEAGLLSARNMAHREVQRLLAKISSLDIESPLCAAAIKFLNRRSGIGTGKLRVTGSLIDCVTTPPHITWHRGKVAIQPQPEHDAQELAVIRDAVRAVGEQKAHQLPAVQHAKQAANTRVQEFVASLREGSPVLFSDGSTLLRSARYPNAGGAGAAALFARGRQIMHKSKPAGPDSCSFSSEVAGFECMLDILAAALQDPSVVETGDHIVCLTDAQSVLSALGRGPLDQDDSRISNLWARLLRMLSCANVKVTLRFVYAHADYGPADAVDELARTAARRGALVDSEHATWWKDKARVRVGPLIDERSRTEAGTTLRGKARVPLAPAKFPDRVFKRLANSEVSILCTLRTNACAALGGHLVGQPHPCPKCGEVTVRGHATKKSMVAHAFTCRRAYRERHHLRIRGLRDLWCRPRLALDYLRDAFDVPGIRPPRAPPDPP